LDFSLSIDEKLISLNDDFRMKLKNKVAKAFIEQAEKLNNKPGLID
jgi:hypothetical protein